MFWMNIICTILLVVSSYVLVECRSYNNGLIFYNLENHNTYLPPTISVSRGRGLAKFKYSSRGSIWSTFGKPCNCKGALCGCCVGIKVKQYNFDQKMCANVSYALPKDEIQLEVFLNDTATAKYGISARNPSPLCIPIMMGIPMSMCIQMSNIGVQGDNLNMCMDFLVRLASTELFEMHFQCMKVGLQGASWVGADGQPVIPANEGKLKDKGSSESEEYYDESEMEEENEVISKEKNEDNIVMNMQEEDSNKAEEELDYNDITEKIMDIVKEQEREEGEEAAKENAELLKENEVEGVSPLKDNTNIEEIVTDIMNSINKGNAAEKIDKLIKTQDKMEANGSEIDNMKSMQESSELSELGNPETNSIAMEAAESNIENMETYLETINFEKIKQTEKDFENEEENKEHKKESIELSKEPVKNETQSLKQDINNLKESAISETELGESNEIVKDTNTENFSNISIKDVLHLEDPFANAEEKETQVENNTKRTQDKESSAMLFTAGNNYTITQEKDNSDKEPVILIKEEPVTERLSEDHDSTNTEKLEILINEDDALTTTELNKNVNDLNHSLEMIQQSMDTTTDPLMSAYLKPTRPQNAETTSEIGNIDSIDNSITTATIMTKTTTTVTKASKPTIPEEIPTVAVSFIENADGVDKNDHKDNDDAGEEVDDEEDNETNDGDNSHENDSEDYDDEESEENEDETTEKIIKSNDATTTTIFMATTFQLNKEKIDSSQKESSANASKSNESTSNEETNENKTNDEFETTQDEFEDNADEKDEEESNQEHENYAEDKEEEEEAEYEEDEDYEETTTVAISSAQSKTNNDTCCRTVTSTLALNDLQSTINNQHDNNKQIPQIETASSNNFHFVSNSNSMISNADINVSNVKTTTIPMLQVITTPSVAAVVSAAGITTKSNVMPLPLARKLFALHHQQQSQLQQQQKQLRYHQQLHRFSRQRQHYV